MPDVLLYMSDYLLIPVLSAITYLYGFRGKYQPCSLKVCNSNRN